MWLPISLAVGAAGGLVLGLMLIGFFYWVLPRE